MKQFGSPINTHDHIWLLTSLVSRVRSPVHLNSLAFISTSGLVLLLLEAVSLVSLYGSIGISVYLLSSESPVFFLSQLSPLPTKIVVWPLCHDLIFSGPFLLVFLCQVEDFFGDSSFILFLFMIKTKSFYFLAIRKIRGSFWCR